MTQVIEQRCHACGTLYETVDGWWVKWARHAPGDPCAGCRGSMAIMAAGLDAMQAKAEALRPTLPSIDTSNKFMVARQVQAQNEGFVFLRPIPQKISDADGLLLAAWIVSMCADEEQWQRVLAAVKAT